MTIEMGGRPRERGIALVYMGVFLVPLLICTGLAVDLGRGYLVRANLAKAVDAAALAAAHNIIATDPSQAERVADKIFYANFPPGFMGVTPSKPDMRPRIGPDGSHIITVTSTAIVPTTFMRLAGRESLEVAALGEATRRLVDMAFVIDRSESLKNVFTRVQDAAIQFVGSGFDPDADRIALITFSSGTTRAEQMRPGGARGFDLAAIDADIANMQHNGATATAEALYQAWDQLRSVPRDSQSGLRIVVLFTDGSPNSFPGEFKVSPVPPTRPGRCDTSTPGAYARARGTLCGFDYPHVSGNSSTFDKPDDVGLYDTYAQGISCSSPTDVPFCGAWDSGPSKWEEKKQNSCIPYLPLKSLHLQHVSIGIPFAFPLTGLRPLYGEDANGYPNHWLNANNAARNLAENIADAIRSDTDGLNGIRIYTLGLGDLLRKPGGSQGETGESILQRIANDPESPDHNAAQLDGKYYYAADPDALKAAFDKVRDEVVRLSQ